MSEWQLVNTTCKSSKIPLFEPPELMRRMVEQGKLGKKPKRVFTAEMKFDHELW